MTCLGERDGKKRRGGRLLLARRFRRGFARAMAIIIARVCRSQPTGASEMRLRYRGLRAGVVVASLVHEVRRDNHKAGFY